MQTIVNKGLMKIQSANLPKWRMPKWQLCQNGRPSAFTPRHNKHHLFVRYTTNTRGCESEKPPSSAGGGSVHAQKFSKITASSGVVMSRIGLFFIFLLTFGVFEPIVFDRIVFFLGELWERV
jgi:hypothetical protein